MLVYWVWFALLKGIPLGQKLDLLYRFLTPQNIYNRVDFGDVPGISPELAERLSNKDLSEAKAHIKMCNEEKIGILSYGDAAYPERLRNISDPPLLLYYKGIFPDFKTRPAIGVVGTRKATTYGVKIAKHISRQIAACGGLVVSGGAAGVDAAALQGGLSMEMPAVAVLGCGVDIVYPASNRLLFNQIQKCGCLVSEYPPGTRPQTWQFPARNRIISGMSNGVLVVEAPQKSGALITARDALDQGRDVFVVPGNIDMPTCAGSNGLLQGGATAVFSGWDVVQAYAADYPETVVKVEIEPLPAEEEVPSVETVDKKSVDNPATSAYSGKENIHIELTEQECVVLDYLGNKTKSMDELIAQIDMPAASVLSIITKLALQGVVVNHPGRLVSSKYSSGG